MDDHSCSLSFDDKNPSYHELSISYSRKASFTY